jgi:hypothetical protein
MNKNRLKKLEEQRDKAIERAFGMSSIWRPEAGKIAIQKSDFIVGRLKSLGREISYSPYVFEAILVEATDSEVIERIEGKLLYLKGIKKPIQGIQEFIWV